MAAHTDEPPATTDDLPEHALRVPQALEQINKPQADDTASTTLRDVIEQTSEQPPGSGSRSSSPGGYAGSEHAHFDGSGEEDALAQSLEEGEVGQLLRATVEALEAELKESRQLLSQRDEELIRLRLDLERYKQQTAREIANKTKLAQALDDSHRHAREMEELMQQWQIEVREHKVQGERMKTALERNHSTTEELQQKLTHELELKDKEVSEMKSQLVELRQKSSLTQSMSHPTSSSSTASDSNPGPETIDSMQLHFLKQAVYHLLTDFHAEDQLRAVVSLLNFSPQERKAVYAKQERSRRNPRNT